MLTHPPHPHRRQVVETIFKALPSIVNVFYVLLLVYAVHLCIHLSISLSLQLQNFAVQQPRDCARTHKLRTAFCSDAGKTADTWFSAYLVSLSSELSSTSAAPQQSSTTAATTM
jgi:hypothetical protein